MTSSCDWSVMSTDSAEVMHPLHARQSASDISARSSFCFCFFCVGSSLSSVVVVVVIVVVVEVVVETS